MHTIVELTEMLAPEPNPGAHARQVEARLRGTLHMLAAKFGGRVGKATTAKKAKKSKKARPARG